MRGIPNVIRSRGDVENLRSYLGTEHDTPEARAAVVAQLRAIRATHQHYAFTRLLASEIDRSGPEPDYRVLSGQGVNGNEIHEYQFVDNPHSRLIDVDMTLTELDQLIAEIS